MDYYEISSETLALIPVDNKKTHIIETNNDLYINCNAINIIDYNCKINGSSYKGRNDSSKLLLETRSKLPVIVEEINKIIFFPTNSIRKKECCWISYNNIKDYNKKDKNIIIIFKNNKKIELNISFKCLETQLIKINRLILKINSKKIK